MNIIEQEDIVKGLPDAALQMEMQMPSGQVPEFLVLSEIQRRSDMRQRYSAQQPMPTSTVKDQVMAEGLAAMMPISSVPAASSPLSPPLPLGDAQQGLAGAEAQMAAQGGLLGMATGGQFPDLSGDGDVTRKDILIGRGVIPMQEGSITPNSFTSRGDPSYLDGMSSSYTGPNDLLIEAGTQFLIKQNIDPTGYTIQELVDIGSQQVKDYSDSYLPYSVADSQGEILGDVVKGSMALLGDKIPDLPETNLGASSAARTRRAEEFASELRRRSNALGDSLSEVDPALSQDEIGARNLELESNRKGIGQILADTFRPTGPVDLTQEGEILSFLPSTSEVADEFRRRKSALGDTLERDLSGISDFFSSLGGTSSEADSFNREVIDALNTRNLDETEEETETTGMTGEELTAQLVALDNARTTGGDSNTVSVEKGGAEGLINFSDSDFRFYDPKTFDADFGGDALKVDKSRATDAFTDIENRSSSLAKSRAEEISELIETNRGRTKNDALYAALAQIGAGIASNAPDLGIGKGSEAASKIMTESRGREDLLRTQEMAAEDADITRQIDFIKSRANIDLNERKLAAEIIANANLQSRNQSTRQSGVANVVAEMFIPEDYGDEGSRIAAYTNLYNALAGAYDVPLIKVPTGSTVTQRTSADLTSSFDKYTK